MKDKVLSHLSEVLANEAMFAIAVFDPEGKSVYLNKMAHQVLAREELELHQLIPRSDNVRDHVLPFSLEFLRHDGLMQ